MPTFKERGLDVVLTAWSSIAMPAGTPPEIVNKMSAALAETTRDPAVVKYYRGERLRQSRPPRPREAEGVLHQRKSRSSKRWSRRPASRSTERLRLEIASDDSASSARPDDRNSGGRPDARHDQPDGRGARARLLDSRSMTSMSAIPSFSAPTPSGRTSTGCARKTRSTTATGRLFGPYWSITKYNDIMEIETNHQVFSSDSKLGGITIRDAPTELRRPMFIAMDQPQHSAQRQTVAPMFTPTHLDELALNIRERSAACLDSLPRNETFDWVDKVSIELTTQMLAVLFDFPWEDRRKLTRWSDVATTLPGRGRRRRDGRGAPGRTDGMRPVLQAAVGRAHQAAAEERPDLDDGAQRSDAEHGFPDLPRQPDPADRRRQRHHPQHALGQHLRAEQVPRSAARS